MDNEENSTIFPPDIADELTKRGLRKREAK
jgi:hypothetical protein